MDDIKVEISNESAVLINDQVQAIVPAFQTQIRDFAPVRGTDADIHLCFKK
ncbi:MAG TPA: hypothetical protein VIO58_08200 [Candidatus Methanoperedens sp.]